MITLTDDTRTGPSINRGGSKQDYETPDDFMVAVHSRFGKPEVDLAATYENAKCPRFISQDSLNIEWRDLGEAFWLNPPFSNISPWAKKCMESAPPEGPSKILFLTPASVGANWFRDFVHGKALVLALNGRLKFKGCKDWYPKDCMLSVFGVAPGFDVWNWRNNL